MQDFFIKHLGEQFGVQLSQARNLLKDKMQSYGVSDRWPAILNLIEEVMVSASVPLAQFLATKAEPLMSWTHAEITQFSDQQIELKLKLAPHLFVGGSWDLAVLSGTAFLPIKWLLEKNAPPGDLKIFVKGLELQNDFPILEEILFVRANVAPEDVENYVNMLMKNGKNTFEASVSFFSAQEKRVAQAHLHIESEWKALLNSEPSAETSK